MTPPPGKRRNPARFFFFVGGFGFGCFVLFFFSLKCATLSVLLADLFISIFAIYIFRDKLAISATY